MAFDLHLKTKELAAGVNAPPLRIQCRTLKLDLVGDEFRSRSPGVLRLCLRPSRQRIEAVSK